MKRYQVTLGDNITAPPVLAADGTLYVASEGGRLRALRPDGSQRFEFVGTDKFKAKPVLSPDAARVYVANEQGTLYAVATANGAQQWQYVMAGPILSDPVLDERGYIVVGSDGDDLVVLRPDGQVSTILRMNDGIKLTGEPQPCFRRRRGPRGRQGVAVVGYMPTSYDGRPDAEPGDLRREWQVSNAVGIDVGADVLHAGSPAVTGEGVTVAVVDSGVYFTEKVGGPGADLDDHFLGQAEFFSPASASTAGRNMRPTAS